MNLHEKNTLILQFIQLLATIRELFRVTHIELDRLPIFRKVETKVSPFENEVGSLEEKVSLSIFLDAELECPENAEMQALGVSLTLRFEKPSWIAEGEIGWSGTSIGWDNFIDDEYVAEDIDYFMNGLPSFVKNLLEKYKNECNNLFGN